MQKPNDNRNNNHSFQSKNWNVVELPLDYPCQIYPRVSTPEQKKNVSAEMQKDKTFAISCGWREDLIILDIRDLGISGQIRMEDRKAFNEMLRRIARGVIKAVVVVNVDRLFRDKWGAESGKFMEICHTYGVLVITPDFVYDFSDSSHIDRFKRKCEEAWNYIEYHIQGRMLPAKDRRVSAGFWAGGNMPMGYVVDTREKINGVWNPDYHRYILYEPHAEVIRWLFRRFKELNGNINLLLSEIKKKPLLFPDFDDTVDPLFVGAAYTHYTKVEGGYTITSGYGLRYIFRNRVYNGEWVYRKEVIKLNIDNYPPAIVDLDTFTYAYNRLSKTKLDGTPNENIVEGRGKRYAKKHFSDRPAILKEVISAADPALRVYTKDQENKNGVCGYYYLLPRRTKDAETSNAVCMIAAPGMDGMVLERLREHMQQPEIEAEYEAEFHDYTTVEDEVVTETSETLKDIERDITATKALIARIKAQVESGKLTDPELAEAANNSYIAAKQDLQRLEQRKKDTTKIASEDQERETYKELMCEVEGDWEGLVEPEDYPRIVYLFIESVTLGTISPYFFSITIKWRDPSWGADHGICYKGGTSNFHWTDEEKALVRQHWETATRKELTELLPRRSYAAMRAYIYRYVTETGNRIYRPSNQEEKGVPYNACLADWAVMQQYGITEADVAAWTAVKLIEWS